MTFLRLRLDNCKTSREEFCTLNYPPCKCYTCDKTDYGVQHLKLLRMGFLALGSPSSRMHTARARAGVHGR